MVLLTCRVSALTKSPPYLQVLCSVVQQPFLPAGFVLCCPTALLICRFCALLSNSPSYLQVLCSELTNGPPHLQVLSSALQRPFLPAGFVLWADQWPSSPAGFVLWADQWPSSPAGFVLWADQWPSSPAGFVLCCPTAFLTRRFSALTNSPPYLQIFCSALTTDVGQESVRLCGLEVQGQLRVGPSLFQLGRAASCHCCVAQELQTHADLQQATSTDRQIKWTQKYVCCNSFSKCLKITQSVPIIFLFYFKF